MNRKIIHIDMDAFFAAVEQRDHPQWQGQPVIVGGQPDSRGVVATCSYEARRFGIHSAMPSARAYQLCPQGIFVQPRIPVYYRVSQQIHAVFREYAERIEPLSLDEAYLDVTDTTVCGGSASLMAEEIRQKIFQTTQLTASAGVSYNKFLAKIASDMNKPNGQYVIRPEQGEAFVAQLAVGKFYGVGKVTEAKMHSLGIRTGADLKAWSRMQLRDSFGKSGDYYYAIARGIDERPVVATRQRKSLGSETTFEQDVTDVSLMYQCLQQLAVEVCDALKNKQLAAYTVTLKVKYSDFQQITRSQTVDEPVYKVAHVHQLLPRLMQRTEIAQRSVRLLGISLSKLTAADDDSGVKQLNLFDEL